MLNKSFHTNLFIFLLGLVLLLVAQTATAQSTVHVIEGSNTSYFDGIDSLKKEVVRARLLPDSTLNRLKNDKAFWYANADRNRPVTVDRKMPWVVQLLQKEWLRNLLWLVIAGAFVAVLLWYLSKLNLQLFRQKSLAIHKEEEALPQNIFAIPYGAEISKAEKSGNYRLAVRLHYLQVLTQLSAKGAITYSQDKTNSDYLMQLVDKAYYRDFFKLTRSFEYSWYGQFAISGAAYAVLQKDFYTFNQQLAA